MPADGKCTYYIYISSEEWEKKVLAASGVSYISAPPLYMNRSICFFNVYIRDSSNIMVYNNT